MTRLLPLRAAAVVLLCAALATALGAPSASAHEGEGILEFDAQPAAPGLSFPYVVRLTWADDGHPAVDATVTATAFDPSGAPQTPVLLEEQGDDGRYAGTVTFPSSGAWTVRFTAVTPSATLEVTQEVAEPPPSTTTSGVTTTTNTNPEASTGAEALDAADASDVDESSGGIAGLLAAGFLAVIVAGGILGFVRARQGRAGR
jgi:hypothetical protein